MRLDTILEAVREGKTVGTDGARAAMEEIMSGAADAETVGALLLALNERGQDAEEIAGFAEGMRAKARSVRVSREPLVDTCGTGGDGLHTVNISTAAGLIAAGAGAACAKHGNRSVSSKCGSADVLEALGVPVDLSPEDAARAVEDTGFAFFFAPLYHPAMKHVAPIRKALGVRTVFNLLGPLANPAGVRRQVIGVYDGSLLDVYAATVGRLGAERSLVVRGEDGMDELTLSGKTYVRIVEAGKGIDSAEWTPEDAGLSRAPIEALRGGDARENGEALLRTLEGTPGAPLDAALYNAGAALYAAGLGADLKEGVALARESVESGKALAVLESQRALRRKNGDG
jgi:anthranilate phosphoribosyltransferase